MNIMGRCKRFPRIEVILAEHPIHSFSDGPRALPLGFLEGLVGCFYILNAIFPTVGQSWWTEYAIFACPNAFTPLLFVSINLLT